MNGLSRSNSCTCDLGRRRCACQVAFTVSSQPVRVAFAKVAEFQARGLVHFHAIIRL
ncbi:MAG: replication initiator [Solirubrobacteraceae bacterium]